MILQALSIPRNKVLDQDLEPKSNIVLKEKFYEW